jgi:hypothetical protein
MSASVFSKLEGIYPGIIDKMPDTIFNMHEFMLKLVEEYQELYIQALLEHPLDDDPSQIVIGKIAQGLKRRADLVVYLKDESVENTPGKRHELEVWQKVRK